MTEAEAIRHTLLLGAGSMLQLRDGNGVRIEVVEGQAWITQEGDVRDLVLTTGGSYRIDRDGLTLVQALTPSRLALRAARDRDRPEPRATVAVILPRAA